MRRFVVYFFCGAFAFHFCVLLCLSSYLSFVHPDIHTPPPLRPPPTYGPSHPIPTPAFLPSVHTCTHTSIGHRIRSTSITKSTLVRAISSKARVLETASKCCNTNDSTFARSPAACVCSCVYIYVCVCVCVYVCVCV